jgi:hypothetical protein
VHRPAVLGLESWSPSSHTAQAAAMRSTERAFAVRDRDAVAERPVVISASRCRTRLAISPRL